MTTFLGATPNEIGLAALVLVLVVIALKGPRIGAAAGRWLEARARGRDVPQDEDEQGDA